MPRIKLSALHRPLDKTHPAAPLLPAAEHQRDGRRTRGRTDRGRKQRAGDGHPGLSTFLEASSPAKAFFFFKAFLCSQLKKKIKAKVICLPVPLCLRDNSSQCCVQPPRALQIAALGDVWTKPRGAGAGWWRHHKVTVPCPVVPSLRCWTRRWDQAGNGDPAGAGPLSQVWDFQLQGLTLG